MSTVQMQMPCVPCRSLTPHNAKQVSHVLHFLVGLFTLGMWWGVWILLALTKGSPQCAVCATRNGPPTVRVGVLLGVPAAVIGALVLMGSVVADELVTAQDTRPGLPTMAAVAPPTVAPAPVKPPTPEQLATARAASLPKVCESAHGWAIDGSLEVIRLGKLPASMMQNMLADATTVAEVVPTMTVAERKACRWPKRVSAKRAARKAQAFIDYPARWAVMKEACLQGQGFTHTDTNPGKWMTGERRDAFRERLGHVLDAYSSMSSGELSTCRDLWADRSPLKFATKRAVLRRARVMERQL